MKKSKEDLIKERMSNLNISRKKVDNKQSTKNSRTTSLIELENSDFLEIEYRDIYDLKKSPPEWNFYKPLNENKMMDLINSILDIELQHPLILRTTEDDEYILAGNNRHEAYRMIYESTKNEFYRKIPTIVKREISDLVAEEIVIDTNFIQREMSPIEKAQSVRAKYKIMGRKGYSSKEKETRNIIAKEYGVTGRMITNYNLLNKLSSRFKLKLENKEVSLKACLKVALIPEELQNYIIENYEVRINNNLLEKVKDHFTKEHIDDIFFKVDNTKILKYVIPIHLSKEFDEMANAWLKERQ